MARQPHPRLLKVLLFTSVFLFGLGSSAGVRVSEADAVPVGAGLAVALGVAAVSRR
jgi:hypothetical protein